MNVDNLKKDELHQMKLHLVESLGNYRQLMSYMTADAPISILGLGKTIETTLGNAGCFRVYDLLNRDLAKIKGIGIKRVGLLTSSLNQFLSMC